MKVIDGKAYKEVKLKDLDKEELLEIIEDLQDRVKRLENRGTTGIITTTPWINTPYVIGSSGDFQLNGAVVTNC